MSSPVADVFRWGDRGLELLDYCDLTDRSIDAADSWLVTDGKVRALELHRARFMTSIPRGYYLKSDPGAFWDAAIAAIPRSGDWFPRVEMHSGPKFLFRLRSAPELRKDIVLATAKGDPRKTPNFKGPDLERLTKVRVKAQKEGADEGVILTRDGYVVEASQSDLVWWRGEILCTAPDEFTRVNSVTRRSLFTLATALGVETHTEAVTPAELDGTEVWALNALHGPRIVTRWVDGPQTAELPGRLALWRARLDALRHPLPEPGVNDLLDWLLSTVQSVDPVLRTLIAGLGMLLETSILVGLIVPGDTVVLVASTGVGSVVEWAALLVAVIVGSLSGESIGFAIGRFLGHHLRGSRLGRWIGEEHWMRAEHYIDRRGGIAIFLSRFLPVLHSLVPVTVGMSTMRYRRFLAWTIPACVLWVFAYVTVGSAAAGSYRELSGTIHWAGYAFVGVVVLFVAAIVVGRRLLGASQARHMNRPGDGDVNTIDPE